jgi:hypothetical protein
MSRIMPAFCASVRPAAMLMVISGIVVLPVFRHGRARPGHPRSLLSNKTWMPGTRPGMTSE